MRILLVWLLLSGSVQAACVTIDCSTWTQEQKNSYEMVAYRLIFEAGEDIVPTRNGDALCFANSTVPLASILTEQTILARYATDEQARQLAMQAEQARQQAFTDEVSTNDLCTATLPDIESRIDAEVAALQAQLDATTNAAEVKAHLRNQLYPKLGAVFKKLGRCVRARAR